MRAVGSHHEHPYLEGLARCLPALLALGGCAGPAPPPEIDGLAAAVLVADVPVPGTDPRSAESVAAIEWSPSGRFVAVRIDDPWTVGDEFAIVVDLDVRAVEARFPGALGATWGDADALWLVDGSGVGVATPPFTAPPASRDASFPSLRDLSSSPRTWALSGRARRAAVISRPDELEPWAVRVETEGAEPFAVELSPRYPARTTDGPSLAFSPSGRWLAVWFSGWIGYEQPGPEELWVVDADARSARPLLEGRRRWWQLFDTDTQSLEPSWTAAEDMVVFADLDFGVEELSIASGRRRRIAGRRTLISGAEVSPTGRWIAVERPWQSQEPAALSAAKVGVLSRDGRRIVRYRDPAAPATEPGAFYSDLGYGTHMAWHPSRDQLVVLRRHPGAGTWDLLSWSPESEPAGAGRS